MGKNHNRRITRVLPLAAAFAIAAPMIASGPAMAADFEGPDPDFTGPTINAVTDTQDGADNGSMYGAYIGTGGAIDGKRIWCGDPGLDHPYADAFNADSASQVTAPNLAYVLWQYDKERGEQTDQMAWDMAIASYLKQSGEIEHRDILPDEATDTPANVTDAIGWNEDSKNVQSVGVDVFNDDVVPAAQENYETIVAEAESKSKSITKAGIDIEGETVTVTANNSAGDGVAGRSGTVTIEGAEFAGGGTTQDFTTTEGESTFDIAISEAGEVTASVEIKDATAPENVTRWRPLDYDADDYDRYSVQDMWERNPGKSISARTSITNENRPSVITTINDQDLQPGDQVYDNFTVEGLFGDSTVDIHHELYYSPVPVEQQPGKPDSATLVGELTSEGVGNGDHKTATVTIPEDIEGGYFYWRESIVEDEHTQPWEGDHGIPDETGFVPYTPEGETQISQESADVLPVEISDDGHISGGMPGQELTVSLEAFKDPNGVIEQAPEIPEGAESLGVTNLTVVLDQNGEGTYTTNLLELAEGLVEQGQSGAVTIVETIAKTDHSEEKTSDYGIPSESIVIDLPAPEEPPTPEEPPAPEKPEEPKPEQPKPGPTVQTGGSAERSMTPFALAGGLLAAAMGAALFGRKRRA